MAKLGYTWYAKDWRSNMDVSELTLQEKGFYRELIDECFIKNSSKIQVNERTFCRLHGINSRTFTKVLQKLHESSLILIENFEDNIISIPSTSKRLGVIEMASKGGSASKKNGEKKVTKLKEKYKDKEKYNNNTTTPAEAEECENSPINIQSPPQEISKESSAKERFSNETFDWDKLLEFINNNTGRSFKVINKAVRSKYIARLRDGYTKDDIISVITNAPKTEFHKENNCQYCTPEYFSRADIIDKYSEVTKSDSETTVAPKMNT